jgi:O-antigen/teichoic acid export membrane protein
MSTRNNREPPAERDASDVDPGALGSNPVSDTRAPRTGSAAGAATRRYRRIAASAVASGVEKAMQLACLVLTVPLTIATLGAERYGVLMTLNSILMVTGFSDLGLGYGLVARLSGAVGTGRFDEARRVVANTLAMLIAIAVGLLLTLGLLADRIPWPALFSIRAPEMANEVSVAATAMCALLLAGLPFGIAQRIHTAHQSSYIQSGFSVIAYGLSLFGIWVCATAHAPLAAFVAVTIGTPILVSALNFAVLFSWARPALRPKISDLQGSTSLGLLRSGSAFFVLQACTLCMFSFDNVIIAHQLGPEAVAQYSLAFRLLAVVQMGLGFIFAPLWPAYGEALANGDVLWVRRTLKRSLQVALIVGGPILVLMPFIGGWIIEKWAGSALSPGFWVLCAVSAQVGVSIIAMPLSVALTGANRLRFQIIISIPQVVCALALKMLLGQSIGLAGIGLATAVSQLVFWVLPVLWYLPRMLAQLSARQPEVLCD